MIFKVFEHIRFSDGVITEYTDGSKWWLEYTDKSGKTAIPMYEINPQEDDCHLPYLGHKLNEVLDSGKDILGNALILNGEPIYSNVESVLPRITEGSYCFIGSTASHSDLIVDKWGTVFPQESGRDRSPKSMYSPCQDNPKLEGITPKQIMLSEEYPILVNIFKLEEKVFEFIYFVEHGDSDKEPILWIREKIYPYSAPEKPKYSYKAVSISRELTYEQSIDKAVPSSTVIDAFADTVAYWIKFRNNGAYLDLPEKKLERAARGTMASAAVTCSADRPHYGHRFYGKELHDNFPPNYIWLIESACIMGREGWAKRVFEYMINYALTDEGRFVYRQGDALNMGASASEYGCILFLADRYFDKLGISNYQEDQLKKLEGMGKVILQHAVPCPEFNGKHFIKMCAEADTNSRIHVYLSNNLWAIRGLKALSSILLRLGFEDNEGYSKFADMLLNNILEFLKKNSVYDSRFGALPPFRFDYTATPHTLSLCKETFAPMTKAEYEGYCQTRISRDDQELEGQDIGENCYACYRYYPEALSAMLLPNDLANGAESLRENLGGEILGMTRFYSHIDNWPILHHARYLIETENIDKYLLLLYAHTEHHGNREKLCYYEQVDLCGKVRANDCLPSLLTTPCMVGWMFAYEKMNGTLSLLSAIPKAWFKNGFKAFNIGYSSGKINFECDGNTLSVSFSPPLVKTAELVIRDRDTVKPEDITADTDYIMNTDKNKVILKNGLDKIRVNLI